MQGFFYHSAGGCGIFRDAGAEIVAAGTFAGEAEGVVVYVGIIARCKLLQHNAAIGAERFGIHFER